MRYFALVLQLMLVLPGALILTGTMNKIHARAEGRRGASLLQPWREIRKLFSKTVLEPRGTGPVFRFAPLMLFSSTVAVALMIPLVSTNFLFSQDFDLFWVVGIFMLGTIALALGALDTGTAFGGMGSSRELMVVALLEPSILMAIYALSIRANSSNIFAIVAATLSHTNQISSPASALSFAGLVIVVIAESGRLPVDNPATHLELTMIHEAMVLEYCGYRLALVKWATYMRLLLLLGLVANLFFPFGLAQTDSGVRLVVGAITSLGKILLLGSILAIVEVPMAKLRLFRVPELLAGSFVLGLLAVTASYYIPTAIR